MFNNGKSNKEDKFLKRVELLYSRTADKKNTDSTQSVKGELSILNEPDTKIKNKVKTESEESTSAKETTEETQTNPLRRDRNLTDKTADVKEQDMIDNKNAKSELKKTWI